MTTRTHTIEYLLEQKSPVRRLAGVVFCIFCRPPYEFFQNRLFRIKKQTFMIFSVAGYNIPARTALPSGCNISTCTLYCEVQYPCSYPPYQRSRISPLVPPVQYSRLYRPIFGVQYPLRASPPRVQDPARGVQYPSHPTMEFLPSARVPLPFSCRTRTFIKIRICRLSRRLKILRKTQISQNLKRQTKTFAGKLRL